MGQEGCLQFRAQIGLTGFQRFNTAARRLSDGHEASAGLRPIHQNRAGPAIACVTADLDAFVAKIAQAF